MSHETEYREAMMTMPELICGKAPGGQVRCIHYRDRSRAAFDVVRGLRPVNA